MLKKIIVTSGEPAGIGPELMYHLASYNNKDCQLVVIGDKALLQERFLNYKHKITLIDYDQSINTCAPKDSLFVIHKTLYDTVTPGVLNVNNAQYVLDLLDTAHQLCISKSFDAVVTAPISKEVIDQSGIKFTGHTEYLQQKCNVKEVVMMLGCKELKVALATTHLPLKEVSAAITQEKLYDIINILHSSLKHNFKIENPCIYICGLNPHAGENGHLGTEELEVMIPVIERLKAANMNLIGPLSADTIFSKQNLQKADAFLAMYHDQGLPVLKYIGFEDGYNTTLGLPYIRTSVDHGTACELCNKGVASPSSLFSAVDLALTMINK